MGRECHWMNEYECYHSYINILIVVSSFQQEMVLGFQDFWDTASQAPAATFDRWPAGIPAPPTEVHVWLQGASLHLDIPWYLVLQNEVWRFSIDLRMCAWSENLRTVVRWSSRCESRGVLLPLFRDRILHRGISSIISTAFADARKMGVGETLVSKSIYKCLMWIRQLHPVNPIACGRLPPLDWSQRRCWRQYQTRSLWWCHRWGSYKTLKPCSSRDSCSNIERTHIAYEIIKIYCSKMIRFISSILVQLWKILEVISLATSPVIVGWSWSRILELKWTFVRWPALQSPVHPFYSVPSVPGSVCFISCFKGSLQQSLWGYRMLLWIKMWAKVAKYLSWYPNSTYPWSLRSF